MQNSTARIKNWISNLFFVISLKIDVKFFLSKRKPVSTEINGIEYLEKPLLDAFFVKLQITRNWSKDFKVIFKRNLVQIFHSSDRNFIGRNEIRSYGNI